MKTIEQAANELAATAHNGDYTNFVQDAFKKGVEFAQQWYDVKDEMPEQNPFLIDKEEINGDMECTVDVLVKTALGDIGNNRRVKNIDGEWVWVYSYEGDVPVTCWRQIEHK